MIEGVIRTRVGYAGGHQANPDYHHIGDHTETVQVDYDPQRISYSQLLSVFWQSHKPTNRSRSRQYMRAIFYHDENQRQQALESKAALAQRIGQAVQTDVLPLRTFTMAENYHQKYLLKQHYGLKAEMTRIYPLHQDFVDSTAVARINGFVGGHGNRRQFSQDIDRLGLSEAGKAALRDVVKRQWLYDRQ